MPILKIILDGRELEFIIIPINHMIELKLYERYSDSDGFVDRPGFLSHVVKTPKMTRRDWGEVPVAVITKIMRSIEYYTESIFKKEKELRMLYVQRKVLEDELDDFFRYLGDDDDGWAWDRIKKTENLIEKLKEKSNKIENSLEMLKSDKVIFEVGKEIDYDVQSV